MSKNLFSLGVQSFTTLLSGLGKFSYFSGCLYGSLPYRQCLRIFNIQRQKLLLIVSFFTERLTTTSEQKVFPNLPRAKAFIHLCQLETVFQWNLMLMTQHCPTDLTFQFLTSLPCRFSKFSYCKRRLFAYGYIAGSGQLNKNVRN